jgi:hypothetical protein
LFITYRELRGVYSDPGLFFKDLLVKEKIIGLLGKLAYDVFEVFYSAPMAEINPYAPHEVIAGSLPALFRARPGISLST